MKTQHLIQWYCPQCRKTFETTESVRPKPQLHCGECLMNHTKTVKMEILTTEPLPPQPITVLVGRDREPVD